MASPHTIATLKLKQIAEANLSKSQHFAIRQILNARRISCIVACLWYVVREIKMCCEVEVYNFL